MDTVNAGSSSGSENRRMSASSAAQNFSGTVAIRSLSRASASASA